ncbi:MAG: hypothetical protein HUK22_02110, partial [Thermoguttaceae bacterium]|nr:hypothetical protein [Thermoguttaceae bacterium]
MVVSDDNDIQEILDKSEEFETQIFFRMARQLYNDCAAQCANLFDVAMEITDDFRQINADAILKDSRIIKILRYCMVPVISQMKLGQLIGLSTTKDFEDRMADSGTRYNTLRSVAPKLTRLFAEQIDFQRFLWLQTELSTEQYRLAAEYAKKWTWTWTWTWTKKCEGVHLARF